jgi:hypothetical protein
MITSALRLPRSNIVHVHKRRTRRCIDRPACAQPKVKQQEHWLALFGRGRHAPDFPAVEIKSDVVLVYSGSVRVKGLVKRTGTNANLPVLRYRPFPLRSVPYVYRSGIPVGHVAIVLDDIHFGRVRCRTIEAIEAHQPKCRPQPLARGQLRPDFKVSKLLCKSSSRSVDRCQQSALPFAVWSFESLDTKMAIRNCEWKILLRIRKSGTAEVAPPRGMRDPSRSGPPSRHVKLVKILTEGKLQVRHVEFCARACLRKVRIQTQQDGQQQCSVKSHLSWLSLRVGRAKAGAFGPHTVHRSSRPDADPLTTNSAKGSVCRRQTRSSRHV